MFKSLAISSIIIFCSIIIESSILTNIPFLYVVPDLVLICSVYFSLLNGKVCGETTGFISGIFLDFVSGSPFGFNCFYRTILGYVLGFFSETVILKGIVIPVITVGAGTILKTILISFTGILFPNVKFFNPGIISNYFLFELIVNVLLAPLCFKFLSFFNDGLSVISTRDRVDNA